MKRFPPQGRRSSAFVTLLVTSPTEASSPRLFPLSASPPCTESHDLRIVSNQVFTAGPVGNFLNVRRQLLPGEWPDRDGNAPR